MPYSAKNIRQRLFELSEENFRQFSAKLLPETTNLLGVRLPILRKFAKEIYKNNGSEYLDFCECEYFEETMLQGMLIGLIEADDETIKKYIRDFVPKINNWAVCDSFCSGLKFVKGREKDFLEFIKPYLKSKEEYDVRFAVVILLNYYITAEYVDTVLELLEQVKHEKYYAKMAVAWAISICYIKFPEKTYEFLTKTKINEWVFNKSIQKINESFKVTPELKAKAKELKK